MQTEAPPMIDREEQPYPSMTRKETWPVMKEEQLRIADYMMSLFRRARIPSFVMRDGEDFAGTPLMNPVVITTDHRGRMFLFIIAPTNQLSDIRVLDRMENEFPVFEFRGRGAEVTVLAATEFDARYAIGRSKLLTTKQMERLDGKTKRTPRKPK